MTPTPSESAAQPPARNGDATQTKDGATYLISTDPALLDVDAVYAFLCRCYWAEGIPREVVARSIANSLCFGLYHERQSDTRPAQVGFARVITDKATFAYLGDVYVLEEHRGRGLSKWLMKTIREHPDLQGLRRFILFTRDAHGLYRQFGFTAAQMPERSMEIVDREVYKRSGTVRGAPAT